MANLSAIKLPSGTTYTVKDNGALQLTGGSVTGPVSFGDSVTMDDLTTGQLVVDGALSVANNLQAYQINGVTVGANPKFTDTVTTVSVTGTGNAVTAASASNGAVTLTKGATFLTAHNTYSITNSGSGNAVTAVSLSGTTFTVTKGTTFLTSHQDISGKADKSATVSNIAYDSTNAKITKTINGTTSDVVTVVTLKTALGSMPASDVYSWAKASTKPSYAYSEITGTVPSSALPSYVDDVLEYTAKANFPTTGETGKIYVDTATNLTWRWGGSAYVEISPSLALGTTSSTAYRGDYGNTAYTHATDANRLTTAKTSGFYKIATTAHGHVQSVTAVAKSDITALGIPAQDTTYESKAAASGGTDVSLVTTGEKYTWNSKTSNTGTITSIKTTAGAHTTVNVSSGAVTFNVPTKTSHLTNDSGFITNAGVTGVKGSAESSYRTGQVNLTPVNIGAVGKNDELLTTNPFRPASLSGPYISKIDNGFYAANKRWNTSMTNISGASTANLFDGSYETNVKIEAGKTSVLTMDFAPTTYFPGYPYGYILVSFYHTGIPVSVSGRVYCNYESHGIGWHNISFSPISDSGTSSMVYRSEHQGYYNISKLEISIVGASNPITKVTQVEIHLDRPDSSRTPFLSKYGAETLYYDLTAPNFKGNLIGNVTGNVSGSAGSVAWTNVSGRPSIPTTAASKVTGITASTTATKTTLGTAFSIPNVTSVGSASNWVFEDVACDDITSWSAGSASSWAFTGVTAATGTINADVSGEANDTLTISLATTTVQSKSSGGNGTAPSLSYTAKTASHVKSGGNGTAPTLGTAFSVPNVTGNTSATVSITDPGHTHTLS